MHQETATCPRSVTEQQNRGARLNQSGSLVCALRHITKCCFDHPMVMSLILTNTVEQVSPHGSPQKTVP